MSHLVAVYPADPGVEGFQELLLEVALLLPPRIVQIVGMNDANHMVKLVSPALAMVIPIQMLWFLKHSHISLQTSKLELSTSNKRAAFEVKPVSTDSPGSHSLASECNSCLSDFVLQVWVACVCANQAMLPGDKHAV